jgi:hypothetical protein
VAGASDFRFAKFLGDLRWTANTKFGGLDHYPSKLRSLLNFPIPDAKAPPELSKRFLSALAIKHGQQSVEAFTAEDRRTHAANIQLLQGNSSDQKLPIISTVRSRQ